MYKMHELLTTTKNSNKNNNNNNNMIRYLRVSEMKYRAEHSLILKWDGAYKITLTLIKKSSDYLSGPLSYV